MLTRESGDLPWMKPTTGGVPGVLFLDGAGRLLNALRNPRSFFLRGEAACIPAINSFQPDLKPSAVFG